MKTLTVPGYRWDSLSEFLKEFPSLKVPLFILMYPYNKLHPVNINRSKIDPIPEWEINKRLEVFKNSIKYAISRQLPLDIDFYLKDIESLKSETTDSYGRIESRRYKGIHISNTQEDDYWRVDPSKNILTRDRGILVGSSLPDTHGSGGGYSGVIAKFLYPDRFKNLNNSSVNYEKLLYHATNSYWSQIIDNFFKHYVAYFEAYSFEKVIDFNEYVNITDLKTLPPYSINYIIVNDKPPVDEVNWETVSPWSKLFTSREGLSILQAAAEEYPVTVATPAPFAVSEAKSSFEKLSTRTEEISRYMFQYVFNDFTIVVDPQLRIIVRYNRKAVSETVDIKINKEKTWNDYVGYAILGITSAALTAGLAAGISSLVTGSQLATGTGSKLAEATATKVATIDKAATVIKTGSSLPSVQSVVSSTKVLVGTVSPVIEPASKIAKAGITVKTIMEKRQVEEAAAELEKSLSEKTMVKGSSPVNFESRGDSKSSVIPLGIVGALLFLLNR